MSATSRQETSPISSGSGGRHAKQERARIRAQVAHLVTTLLDQQERRIERTDLLANLLETVRIDQEAARRIATRNVETHRHHHHFGAMAANAPQRSLQCGQIELIVTMRRQRDVEVV